jgi:hypothetical protein
MCFVSAIPATVRAPEQREAPDVIVESLFRWAGVRSRSDCPSVHELVAAGWEPVAHDTRYGSTLCRLTL